MKTLAGKSALVTGGSRGLGPLIAHALAARGVRVALVARSPEPLAAVAAEIAERHGAEAVPLAADLGDPAAREAVVDRARSALGAIDILINNAGIEWVSSFPGIDPAVIERIVTTNLTAPLVLTRLVLPEMVTRGSGHVVTVSSMAGRTAPPFGATYAATKAGLIAWTEALRTELQETGVGVSVVTPGFVAEAGMFAEYQRRAPRIAGESRPQAVADAVVRAIIKNRREILVNPGPVRLTLVARAISPRFVTWLLRKGGVHRFYREQAEINEQPRLPPEA